MDRDKSYSVTSISSGGTGGSNSTWVIDPWEPYRPYDYRWPYTGTTTMHTWKENRCKYCDGRFCKEPEQCPRVKSVSYFKDGAISKIEFHKPEED